MIIRVTGTSEESRIGTGWTAAVIDKTGWTGKIFFVLGSNIMMCGQAVCGGNFGAA